MYDVTSWVVAFFGAEGSFLLAAANGKSHLSRRIEREVSRFLPASMPRLTSRYIGLFFIGAFSAAYTLYVIMPADLPNVFAGSIASAIALETFPGPAPDR